jgi:hypothetical protein
VNFHDLITRVFDSNHRVNEDGAAPAPVGPSTGPNVGGATTENDIQALPVHLGASTARRKKKKVKMIKGLVKEAVDKDLERLRKELKLELIKMFNHDEFVTTVQVWNAFKSAFGAGQSRTQRTAVTCERQQKDAQKLYGDLLREHGDDKGSIEMIISAIQEKRPLGQFPVMRKYDNLFGTRTGVDFQGIKIVFEATVDFIYDPTQTMYIDDLELLDRIEEDFGSIIKRSKNVLYPVGGKFNHDFFNQLKSMMSDNVEELKDEEQSDKTA